MGIIEDGHLWIEALSKRNLTTHTYDEAFAGKFVEGIKQAYFPIAFEYTANILLTQSSEKR